MNLLEMEEMKLKWLSENTPTQIPEGVSEANIAATGICNRCGNKFIPMAKELPGRNHSKGFVNKKFVGDVTCYYCRKILIQEYRNAKANKRR